MVHGSIDNTIPLFVIDHEYECASCFTLNAAIYSQTNLAFDYFASFSDNHLKATALINFQAELHSATPSSLTVSRPLPPKPIHPNPKYKS